MTLARTITIFAIVSCAALAFPGNAELVLPAAPPQTSQTLSVDVDLVLINATVTDSRGNYVTGLDKEYFQIWEDKVQQEIQYFSAEDVALSGGILLDVSGSMKESLSIARSAAVTFLRMGNHEDEYFLIQFSTAARLL
jgi:Ca-activated chloride channel family protein